MTIHARHPFDDGTRETARQLRARIGGRVGVFTAGEGGGRAGWTVSSLAVVAGDPWRVVAFVDPDCDLAERAEQTGRAVLQLLDEQHRHLADAFAGQAPAPGGVFTLGSWLETPWGPRLADAPDWAGLRLEHSADLGWLRQLTFTVERAEVGDDEHPLHHARGRYRIL